MTNVNFEFAQNGAYGALIYTFSEGEALVPFDDGMLMNNEIKGVLSYTYEKGAGNSMLSYNILRGTRLSLLRNGAPMSKRAALLILTNIADILISNEEYMLSEEHFVLADDCIFVEPSTYCVYLVYVPTSGFYGISFVQYVRNFISNEVFSTEENTSYLMNILNFLNTNPKCTVLEMKNFLLSQMENNAAVSKAEQDKPDPYIVDYVIGTPPDSDQKKGIIDKIINIFKNDKKPEAIQGVPAIPPAADKPDAIKSKDTAKSPLGGINIPGLINNAPPKPKEPKNKLKDLLKNDKINGNVPKSADQRVTPQTGETAILLNTPPDTPEAVTVLDEETEDTFSIGAQGGISSLQPPSAYLLDGRGVKTIITKSGFMIGRESRHGVKNDFLIKNQSVGRNHAMIKIQGGRYYVIDLTSLNGTYINGDRICGNIETEIHDGDKLTFGNEGYTFKIQ